jgi:hypothetical protein
MAGLGKRFKPVQMVNLLGKIGAMMIQGQAFAGSL